MRRHTIQTLEFDPGMRQNYANTPAHSDPSPLQGLRQQKSMMVEDNSISTKKLVNDIDELLEESINDGANGRLQGKMLREVLNMYDDVLELIDEYISSWNGDAGCTKAKENIPQLVPAVLNNKMQQDTEQTIENLLDDYGDYFATQEQELGQHNCQVDKHANIAEPIRSPDCKLSNVRSSEW